MKAFPRAMAEEWLPGDSKRSGPQDLGCVQQHEPRARMALGGNHRGALIFSAERQMSRAFCSSLTRKRQQVARFAGRNSLPWEVARAERGALSSPGEHCRVVREPVRVKQALAFGVAASLVAGGAWTAVWFATPPPASEVQAATAPKLASATIHLNSDPQGAEATTSLGSSCQTPCSIKFVIERSFTVTFTHRGFVSSTVPVETEAPQPGTSDAKFSPDPVFAALQPIPQPKILEPKEKTERARIVAHRTAPPREVREEPRDGLVSRSWKYLQEKTHAWQMRVSRLVHGDFQ